MGHPHAAHHAVKIHERRISRPDPVPRNRLPHLTVREAPSLVRRQAVSSTSCGSDSNSPCPKSTSSLLTTTLPVVLGALIPIACAVIVLIYLHRRHVRKLRNEDANDKHKSLDFGMDFVEPGGRKGSKRPEMSMAEEKNIRKRGGMSLDIGNNPYLLPPGLHNSRESLRSLSRSISIDDDKYRPATSLAGDNASLRSYPSHPNRGQDDTNSVGGSARRAPVDDMQRGLLWNAQRISRSSPPLDAHSPVDGIGHERTMSETGQAHQGTEPPRNVGLGDLSQAGQPVAPNQDDDYLKSFIHSREPPSMDSREGVSDHTASHVGNEELPGQTLTARDTGLQDFNFETNDHQSYFSHSSIPEIHETPVVSDSTGTPAPRISFPLSDGASDYGDNPKFENTLPAVNVSAADEQMIHADGVFESTNRLTQHFSSFDNGYDPHRLTVAIRPLPPEDPSDNAEQRANRIRSFYKEYFDDTKGGQEEYYEDFGSEFYEDGVVYDPTTGEYLMGPPKPFAQPVGRRAMTPPPRFQGSARHMTTNSAGGFMPAGPRAFSSASGRLPGMRGPRKPLPPPAPLHILPSPHMLKDDSLITPIDFAPGKTYKDQREGRPETPKGGLRPYTPVAPSHLPLASSFDDLAAIPSPHALRKSGAYMPLDFAPPARFKNNDTMSDAGSIRSNRSGISTTHLRNIRTGAYRVSRLPTDAVGTKDDIASSLHPKWDMGR